ncbi:MAG: hypothetical protein KBG62_05615, partial [Propionivibrio sp.]|nr:hypothetical protein [Propionivibrio sp.]
NRAACRGKRCAFPTAQPFAHKPHRPLFILNKFIKNDHTRGKGKTGHGTNACGRKKRLTVQPPFFLRPFLFTHQGASHV